ncbi:MAG: prolyl oligopeptidase family serine peptidase [Phycisphaerae bacterium]
MREGRSISWKHTVLSVGVLTALLTGCAVTQPQNTPVRERLEMDPVTGRGYWLYVPSTYRHDKPAPLIVSCHGTPPFDVAEHHIREWKMLAEDNGCIVVAPELVGTDGLIGDGPIVAMLTNERLILSVISQLAYRYNLDRANMMITGFSGGGFPTYWIGLRHPELFNCVVARNCNFSRHNLHGWYPSEATDIHIMVYYGQNDPSAIVAQSKQAVEYLRANDFRVETDVLPGAGHERRPEVAMRFFLEKRRRPEPTLPSQ